MDNNKMTAEKVPGLLDWLYRAGYHAAKKDRDYDPRGHEAWQACHDAFIKALSAPRVPAAWLVTRDRDPIFPRVYLEKEYADKVVSFVDVNPPAAKHPLYMLAASPDPVAQTVDRDRIKELEGYNLSLATESHNQQQVIAELRAEVEALRAQQVTGMANARRMIRGIKTKPNWWLFAQLFGTGKTTAMQRCESLGIDPDAARLHEGADQ